MTIAITRAGSGSRPETDSRPHPSTPAEDAAGAHARKPETSDA